ncbi:MAG: hypothetical protein GWN83_04490, partial [Gemmatimonadetes bacterium]|nr:hypothetical protein [Gemmatimonadota bacterium]
MHEAAAFHTLVRKERQRSERTNEPFSLVVFENDAGASPALPFKRLERELLERVRELDEIGWYDERRIGVLLPHTAADGAESLAEDIQAT